MIALGPGENPELESAVRPQLRPADRWIADPSAGEYEFFQRGAREATGKYLFITEAHCVPMADCLETLLDEVEHGRAGGAGRERA